MRFHNLISFAPIHWVTLMAFCFAMIPMACGAKEDVPPLERRAQALNKTVMCPVCPGESIDQSQNVLAVQMRAIVDEKMREGWSESQIKNFFVERYGPGVLLEPARTGFTLLVWVFPVVAAILTAVGLFISLKLMRRSAMAQPESERGTNVLSDMERDQYFIRIQAALELDSSADDSNMGPGEPRSRPGGLG